jgi:hypothetical protein
MKVLKTCFRWLLLVCSIGGGFAGIAVTLQVMMGSQSPAGLALFLNIAFVALYAFVVVSGLIFADNPNRTTPLIIALIIQIPRASSPMLACGFSTGFHAILGFIGGRVWAHVGLGTEYQLSIMQGMPWGLGINIFPAIAVIVLLVDVIMPKADEAPAAIVPAVAEDGASSM